MPLAAFRASDVLGGFLGGLANLGTAYGGYLGAQNLYNQNQLQQLQLQNFLQNQQAQQNLVPFYANNPQLFPTTPQPQPGTATPGATPTPSPLQPLTTAPVTPVQTQQLPNLSPTQQAAAGPLGLGGLPGGGPFDIAGLPGQSGFGGGGAAPMQSTFGMGGPMSPFGPGQPLTGPALSGTGLSPTGAPQQQASLTGVPGAREGLGQYGPLANYPGAQAPDLTPLGPQADWQGPIQVGATTLNDAVTGTTQPVWTGSGFEQRQRPPAPQLNGLGGGGIVQPAGGFGLPPQYTPTPPMQGPVRPQARAAVPDLAGGQNLLPQYDRLGATRPLGPGEYVMNSDGSWSNEYTTTVQDPQRAGQYMVIPTLWLQNGKPTILSEDDAANAAANSGLNFPRFGSLQAAKAYADRREQNWQNIPLGRTDMQPALWSQADGGAAVPGRPAGGAGGGFAQVVQLESGGDINIGRGAAGEWGPAQILESTFQSYARPGEDIRDPRISTEVAQRYYNDLLNKSNGDYAATLVGYNRGEEAMRRFQAAGDNLDVFRGTRMMPTAAYQRAIRAAGGRGGGDSAEVVNATAEMGSNLSREQHGIGTRGAQILMAMPQLPQAIPYMNPSQVAQLIQQQFPGTSDAVKGALFVKILPMMNEYAKEQTANAWNGWKAQMEQLEFIQKEEDIFTQREETRAWREAQLGQRVETGDKGGQVWQPPDVDGVKQPPVWVTNRGEVRPLTGTGLAPGSTKPSGTQQQPLPELKYPSKWEGMPDKPPPNVREDVWDATLYFARTHQMPAIGFQPGMRNQIIQAYPASLHALGIAPSEAPDIAAAYAGERHGEIVGGGRAAQISLGIEESIKAAPQVVSTSLKVPRFQLPPLNQFWNWLQEKTGNPEIVAFRDALNTYLNIYASVVSRTGRLTDSQQAHAYELLSTSMNQGQLQRGIEQLNYEMQLMKEAVPPAMEDIKTIGQPPALRQPTTPAPPPGQGGSAGGGGTPDTAIATMNEEQLLAYLAREDITDAQRYEANQAYNRIKAKQRQGAGGSTPAPPIAR